MEDTWKDYRKESRANWGRDCSIKGFNNDDLQIGAVLRIADSLELIASHLHKIQRHISKSPKQTRKET